MSYEEAVLQLHGWFEEWAEVARTEIGRRHWLIRLGLAQRRSTVNDIPTEGAAPQPAAADHAPTESPAQAAPETGK